MRYKVRDHNEKGIKESLSRAQELERISPLKMSSESVQGHLVSSPTDDEDDDEEKLLFRELVLIVTGSLLPSKARAKKNLMEDCPDELDIKYLEEWFCGASRCLEEVGLY